MASEGSRKKIVETALQMFNCRGVRGVTMDDIAAAMHMSKRTLYESFANKEELLTECMMMVYNEILERHKSKDAYCGADELLLMALYMIRVNAMLNFKYKHLKEEVLRYYPEINERFFALYTDTFRKTLTQTLQHAQDNHSLRPNVNIDTTVEVILNYVQHHHHILKLSNTNEYANLISEIGFTFLRGLMSTETIIRYENNESKFHSILESLKTNL